MRGKITECWLAETEGTFSSSRGHFWTLPRVFSTFVVDKLVNSNHWKKRLKISKIAKFKSDLLKNKI